jgi:hypothetical protein
MVKTVEIDPRFNGPPTSGNGGYSCGLMAREIAGASRIRLHRPPPLDLPLGILPSEGGALRMFAGDELVGTAAPTSLDLRLPQAPSLEAAAKAATRWRNPDHIFPSCFVCGPARAIDDGLHLRPGRVDGEALFACTWRPRSEFADADGRVRTEIIWAALDCPGYYGAMGDRMRPALLGELEGSVTEAPEVEQDYVVVAWPLGQSGRKHFAGTAIFSAEGRAQACARSIWIETRSP